MYPYQLSGQEGLRGFCCPATFVAECIETTPSCFIAGGLPTVAADSAFGMGPYRWHKRTRVAIVFADHDLAGLTRVRHLRGRASAAGLRSRVLPPADADLNWNDVLRADAAQEGAPA
jgi:hypothetical protein